MAKKYNDKDLEQIAEIAARALIADNSGDREGAKALYRQAETIANNKRKK